MANGTTCQACNSICATCITTDINCLSCNAGRFLKVNKCETDCGDRLANWSTNICVACTDPCWDCSNTVLSTCT